MLCLWLESMGFYETIDQKILVLYNKFSQYYQKTTGNTNYDLMAKCGYLGCASLTVSGLEIIVGNSLDEVMPLSKFAGVSLGILGLVVGGLIHLAANSLEKSTFEDHKTNAKNYSAEVILNGFQKIRPSILFLIAPLTILVAYIGLGKPLQQEAVSHSMMRQLGFLALGCAFYGSALYFASCEPRKPHKKSILEKLKAFFSFPKIAEATSQYQVALYPYI